MSQYAGTDILKLLAKPTDVGFVNTLYYGDNLDSLRKYVKNETVDLCYIDPPFNSKRSYFQVYNNLREDEDRALAQAFIDTWKWDAQASEGYQEIMSNERGLCTAQTMALIKGLRDVLKEGSLLAYLVSMTRRILEIHRVLKTTGTFYLHCDPTASHYLKLVLDGIFCSQGGDFKNEIIWCYSHGGKSKRHFGRKHDVLFFYTKSNDYTFNGDQVHIAMKSGKESFGGRLETDPDGREYRLVYGTKNSKGETKYYKYYLDEGKLPEDWWTDINSLQATSAERMGYPTQKPLALMERIIKASSEKDGLVLDAYCGCGTTVAAAQHLGQRWIGMDITYQAISVIMERIQGVCGKEVADAVCLNGVPRDMESARALANKKDDRVRKEFEKWAVLAYTMNRASINDKKGADGGIDGVSYFLTGPDNENDKIVFQVKSGKVGRGDIAKLNSDRQREKAALATLITLEDSTSAMRSEATSTGFYTHSFTGRTYPCVQIVTVREIIEGGKRLELPLSLDALKTAPKRPGKEYQKDLDLEESA
jgi:site-specific DNA-methyltransferase (adenine-specific)